MNDVIMQQLKWLSRILNAYGPTEATIVTTLVEISDSIINQYPLLPIGYPMTNSKILNCRYQDFLYRYFCLALN